MKKIGLFAGSIGKLPLFSFSINVAGRPYYAATGQFMKYSKATAWWLTDFLNLPLFINYGSILFVKQEPQE